MDVGQDAAPGDGHAAQELVQLLVVLHGQCDVTGHDARLLVVPRGVPGELENLRAQVLEDGGEVDGGAGSHARCVLALADVPTDATHGKLKSGLRGRGGAGLLLASASLAFSRHDGLLLCW